MGHRILGYSCRLFMCMSTNRAALILGCNCSFRHQRSLQTQTLVLWLPNLPITRSCLESLCSTQTQVALWHYNVKNSDWYFGGRPVPVQDVNIAELGLKVRLSYEFKSRQFYRNANTPLVLFHFPSLHSILSPFQPPSSYSLLPLPRFLRFMSPRDLLSGAVWTKTMSFSDLIHFPAILHHAGDSLYCTITTARRLAARVWSAIYFNSHDWLGPTGFQKFPRTTCLLNW